MALGVICLAAGIGASWGHSAAAEELAAVRAQLQVLLAATASDTDQVAALTRHHRAIEERLSELRRRRIGWVVAGLILLVGGFFAAGMRRLHEKRPWVVLEGNSEDESSADGAGGDIRTCE